MKGATRVFGICDCWHKRDVDIRVREIRLEGIRAILADHDFFNVIYREVNVRYSLEFETQ